MKKFLLTATAIAALTAVSTSAFAVDLDDCALVPANIYAQELAVAGPLAGTLSVTNTAGAGNNPLQDRFFKYTLTNGTFTAAVVPATDFTPFAPLFTSVAQGGQIGDNFVIINRGPTAGALTAASIITLNLTGKVAVVDPTSSVGVSYELHETLGSAQGANDERLAGPKSCDLAKFAKALAFSATPNTTTADVDAVPMPYTSFLDGVNGPGGTLAKIGNVRFEPVAGVLNPFTGNQVLMSELVKVGTKLVLKTNKSWASMANPPVGVYLSGAAGNCLVPPGGAIVGTVVNPTTIDIQTNALASATRAICYQADGTTPIEVQDFTVAFDVVPQTAPNPATTADEPAVPAGKFIRNGTILKHAFIQTGSGVAGFTHSVHLANRSGLVAPYQVRCLTENGTFAGAANPVPLQPFQARSFPVGAAGLGCTRGDTRGIELIFGVPDGSVIGAVLRTNTTTGETNYDTMIGSQIGSR